MVPSLHFVVVIAVVATIGVPIPVDERRFQEAASSVPAWMLILPHFCLPGCPAAVKRYNGYGNLYEGKHLIGAAL